MLSILYKLLTLLFAPSRRRAPRRVRKLRRVLVIKPCCFGDVVMATAALAALARVFPEAEIDLAVGAWSRPAVAGNPRLVGLIDSDPVGTESIRRTWRDYLRLARRLRARRYEAVLVLDRSPLLGLLAWLTGARVRAGLDSGGRGFALTHRVPCPPDAGRHEVAWYLDLVRALGVPVHPATRTEFYPTAAESAEAAALLAELGLNTPLRPIALHTGGGANPGMRLAAKRWAPDRWAAVLTYLLEADPQARVLLVGGPGADDRAGADAIRAGVPPALQDRVLDGVGRLGWGALGALLGQCRLFLGPDTGALHLAVAAGTPAVAVFGPSDPRRYGPWDPGGPSRAVGGTATGVDLAARAAALAAVPYHTSVSVDEVWQAVEAVLRAT
jgi:ADP-heptose:LPS heptosyltransferase